MAIDLDHFRTRGGVAADAQAVTLTGEVIFEEPAAGWTEEADVVVIGSGAAAMAAACAAADAGATVSIFEKGPLAGGTTFFSGAALHIYDNPNLRRQGIEDPRAEALAYLARCGYPAHYSRDAPRHGLSEYEFGMLEAYYERGTEAIAALTSMGAAQFTSPWIDEEGNPFPDYCAHFEENVVPRGRGMKVTNPDGTQGTGPQMLAQLRAFAEERGATLRLEHRAVGVVCPQRGVVSGVVVRTGDELLFVRARGGVVFGSGGLAHNPALRRQLLKRPVCGGPGRVTNTGDFFVISQAAGADMSLMPSGWWCEQVAYLADDLTPTNLAVWTVPGDGVVLVNRYGKRVVNEKSDYQNLSQVHLLSQGGEYPNQYLFMVWDERTARRFAGRHPLPPDGMSAPYVLRAGTIDELAARIDEQLRLLSASPELPPGDAQLADDFCDRLRETIERFNGFATVGKDADFRRGEFPLDNAMHGPAAPDNDLPNKTMYPLDASGDLHAIVLVCAAFDTRCGPRIDPDGRVLARDHTPIEGLYGAGNCVASVLGEGYPGGGSTIGPALTFGYMAGRHAAGRAGTR